MLISGSWSSFPFSGEFWNVIMSWSGGTETAKVKLNYYGQKSFNLSCKDESKLLAQRKKSCVPWKNKGDVKWTGISFFKGAILWTLAKQCDY